MLINYRDQDFVQVMQDVTGGRGANVILDNMGAAYLERNVTALARDGRLVIIGLQGGIKAELNLALMMVKRQQIIGSVLRSRPVAEKGEIVAEFTRLALPKFADRSIVPMVPSAGSSGRT